MSVRLFNSKKNTAIDGKGHFFNLTDVQKPNSHLLNSSSDKVTFQYPELSQNITLESVAYSIINSGVN